MSTRFIDYTTSQKLNAIKHAIAEVANAHLAAAKEQAFAVGIALPEDEAITKHLESLNVHLDNSECLLASVIGELNNLLEDTPDPDPKPGCHLNAAPVANQQG